MTTFPDFTMGESVRQGTVLFIWKSDGHLYSQPDGTLARMAPIGIAGDHLDRASRVRMGADKVLRRLIYNPCGDRHLGRCCINCLRADGSRGLTCTHCGGAITEAQRDQITASFEYVKQLRKRAGAS